MSKPEARVVHNAEALIGYFDSMAFASEADEVQPTLRHVLEIERTPLFRDLASLIVDVYYRQRASKCVRDRIPYKQRHQNATMLSYKSRIAHALVHGSKPSADSDTDDDDDDDNAGSHTGSTTTDDDDDAESDTERPDVALMISCDPGVIGTRQLGRASQWRLCDDADRKCIGRLRQFASWWFTNFAFAMLSVRYRDELIAHILPIENRVRAVCGFNTLVPWCMNLDSELTIEDAATHSPTDEDAQAAHAYASCRYVRDGIISRQAALFAGFVCINAMHPADTCLPPLPLSASVNRSMVHCGVLQHPVRQDTTSIALHYNSERAIRIGNLAMNFMICKHRHTVPELQKHDRSIVQATLRWLREQILHRLHQPPSSPATTAGGNCVKGYLPELMNVLEESVVADTATT